VIERTLRAIPAIAWMAFIFAMSSKSQIPQPFGYSTFALSIVAHFILYGVLAVLLLIAFHDGGAYTRTTMIAAVAGAFLYGISDEFHQSFVPGRDPSLMDIGVNTLGAVFAVTVWSKIWPALQAMRSR